MADGNEGALTEEMPGDGLQRRGPHLAPGEIPHEDDVETEANSRTGIFHYFRVARVEYQKFIFLGLMFGICAFIYSFMRILKDMFVMVRQEPTAILFIKIFYILPVSMALVFLIQCMLNTKTVSKIFSIFCGGFAGLFFVYGLILLFEQVVSPSRFLFRDAFADGKMKSKGVQFFMSMFLTFNEPLATMVYITAEMWGSLLFSYLFLSFLNESCTIRQFARFIPALYIIANLALLLSANITGLFFWLRKKFTFEQNQLLLAGIFISLGLMVVSVILLKMHLENVTMARPIFIPAKRSQKKKPKVSVSLTEGFEIMAQSKLLIAISSIVLFFNMSYNTIETTFKAGVKMGAEHFNKEKGSYSGKFNQLDQYMTSLTVIGLNMSSFSTLIETRGFLLVGLITPLIIFFALVITLGLAMYNTGMEQSGLPLINSIFSKGAPLYSLENYSGIIFLSLLKITKYSAFDICKERLGMRINPTYRPRFKSVYDGIFGKLGKSIGSIYGLVATGLLSTEDLRKAAPITAIIILIFFVLWIKAAIYLAEKYEKSVECNKDVDIDMFETSHAEAKEEALNNRE
jgi:ATP:ADP antiporter, AAA family